MLNSDQIVSNEERVLAAVGQLGKGGGFLLVRRDGLDVRDNSDVQGWAWKVLDFEGHLLGHGNDLFTPWYGDSARSSAQCLEALRSLTSFLSACAESESEDDENYSLFGPAVRIWAEMNSDELQMLSLEIDALTGDR